MKKINLLELIKRLGWGDTEKIVLDLAILLSKNNFNIYIVSITKRDELYQKFIHSNLTHSIIIATLLKILNPSLKIVYTSHSLNIGSKFREVLVWMVKPFRNNNTRKFIIDNPLNFRIEPKVYNIKNIIQQIKYISIKTNKNSMHVYL